MAALSAAWTLAYLQSNRATATMLKRIGQVDKAAIKVNAENSTAKSRTVSVPMKSLLSL